MLEKITPQAHHLIYESLEELHHKGSERCQRFNPHAFNSSENLSGESWYGVKTSQDAKRKALEGWPELHAILKPMSDRLELGSEVTPHIALLRRRKRVKADFGDELDMHQVYSGNLATAWSHPKRMIAHRHSERFATLAVNVAVNANVGFNETLWRAATALKICDMMQAAGRSLEIYITVACDYFSSNLNGRFACRVKKYSEPLVIERLAAMSSAAFLRTFGFVMIGSANCKVAWGLGHATQGMPDQLAERRKTGELVIDVGQVFTEAQAREEILKVEKQLKESTQ